MTSVAETTETLRAMLTKETLRALDTDRGGEFLAGTFRTCARNTTSCIASQTHRT